MGDFKYRMIDKLSSIGDFIVVTIEVCFLMFLAASPVLAVLYILEKIG